MILVGYLWLLFGLEQEYSNLAREIYFPAEFSSNPDQTHLSMLTSVFTIRAWSGVELNSGRKVDFASQIWGSLAQRVDQLEFQTLKESATMSKKKPQFANL